MLNIGPPRQNTKEDQVRLQTQEPLITPGHTRHGSRIFLHQKAGKHTIISQAFVLNIIGKGHVPFFQSVLP